MGKIIYLEADEEITSVIDRLKAIEDRKVALIVPRNATLCSSVVNLKLLKKNSDELNKELFLVASDDSSKTLIQKAGLVSYPRLDKTLLEEGEEEVLEAEKPEVDSDHTIKDIKYKKQESHPTIEDLTFRKGKLKEAGIKKSFEVTPRLDKVLLKQKNKKLKIIIVSAIVAVLVLAAGASAFFLPSATVSLTMYSQPFDFEKTYSVSTDKDSKAILAEVVETEKEQSGSAKTSGKKNVGEKATGTITVSNIFSTTAQNLAAGTSFKSSSGLIFKTKTAVSVPGYTDPGGGPVPGQVNVSVEAADVGAQYNIGAGHFVIPAFAGDAKYTKIYGDSSAAMAGGSSRVAIVVSADDINNLKTSLEEQVKTTLSEEIKKEIKKDQELLSTAATYTTVSVKPSHEVDAEVEEFDMTIKVKASALVFNKDDLDKKINSDLKKQVGEDEVLIEGSIAKIKKEMTDLDIEKGTANLAVTLVSQTAPEIDQDILKKKIAGRSIKNAQIFLKEYEEIAKTKITISPSWWWSKNIPSKSKIHIKLDYTPAEKTESSIK